MQEDVGGFYFFQKILVLQLYSVVLPLYSKVVISKIIELTQLGDLCVYDLRHTVIWRGCSCATSRLQYIIFPSALDLKTQWHRRSKGIIALTPPTFSKYAQWLPKWMSCSLKNQVNLRSSVGSWDTWQGSTMLSPTVTSRWPAGLVIKVGSVNREQHIFRVAVLFY